MLILKLLVFDMQNMNRKYYFSFLNPCIIFVQVHFYLNIKNCLMVFNIQIIIHHHQKKKKSLKMYSVEWFFSEILSFFSHLYISVRIFSTHSQMIERQYLQNCKVYRVTLMHVLCFNLDKGSIYFPFSLCTPTMFVLCIMLVLIAVELK